jgi:hypothetical protein
VRRGPALIAALLFTASVSSAEDDRALAKASQNPIGNLISVPLETNVDFGVGTKDTQIGTFTFKPVYPTEFGDVRLINRVLLPIQVQG